jgi:hypothetical protein
MQFEEIYDGWQKKRFNQEEAARLLGVCERSFRRYICAYEREGLDALMDKRLNQISHWRAPVDEVMALVTLYRGDYFGWNVKHFYRFYKREHAGIRGYTWVKKVLQADGAVPKGTLKGKHRKRRERSPMAGMMIHQDGSTHEWVPEQKWDLIITLDDATGEHYSMFFVDQEGTESSFRGVQETIEKKGLFCSFYSDRGSHYWTTPTVDGAVDKTHLTQFGRAMKQLGIEMIAAYSPQARGRCERMFGTHQGRLPNELAIRGISDKEQANIYLKEVYMPAFNEEFMVEASEANEAFVPMLNLASLRDILCEHHERTVSNDNCVRFEGLSLQIPKTTTRCHYIKAKVQIHRYQNGDLGIFHGPRLLATYDKTGQLQAGEQVNEKAA